MNGLANHSFVKSSAFSSLVYRIDSKIPRFACFCEHIVFNEYGIDFGF